jgi:hypothetical protein
LYFWRHPASSLTHEGVKSWNAKSAVGKGSKGTVLTPFKEFYCSDECAKNDGWLEFLVHTKGEAALCSTMDALICSRELTRKDLYIGLDPETLHVLKGLRHRVSDRKNTEH